MIRTFPSAPSKRKGYKIDGCIHWLIGSRPGNPFYPMWKEVGALVGPTIIDHEEFLRIEGREGQVLTFYTDLNRLEQHLKEIAPEDSDVIEEFIGAALDITRINVSMEKAPEVLGLVEKLMMIPKMFPFLKLIKKWGTITASDFARRFQNPFLR